MCEYLYVCTHVCVFSFVLWTCIYALTISSYPVILHSYPFLMCLCATAQPSLICHIFQLHFKQFISYFGPCPFLTPALLNHHCTQVIRTKTTHERHWRGHYFQALCLSFDSNISAKRSKKFESGWVGATFIGGKVSLCYLGAEMIITGTQISIQISSSWATN